MVLLLQEITQAHIPGAQVIEITIIEGQEPIVLILQILEAIKEHIIVETTLV